MKIKVTQGEIEVEVSVPGAYNTDALDDMATRAIRVHKDALSAQIEAYGTEILASEDEEEATVTEADDE